MTKFRMFKQERLGVSNFENSNLLRLPAVRQGPRSRNLNPKPTIIFIYHNPTGLCKKTGEAKVPPQPQAVGATSVALNREAKASPTHW